MPVPNSYDMFVQRIPISRQKSDFKNEFFNKIPNTKTTSNRLPYIYNKHGFLGTQEKGNEFNISIQRRVKSAGVELFDDLDAYDIKRRFRYPRALGERRPQTVANLRPKQHFGREIIQDNIWNRSLFKVYAGYSVPNLSVNNIVNTIDFERNYRNRSVNNVRDSYSKAVKENSTAGLESTQYRLPALEHVPSRTETIRRVPKKVIKHEEPIIKTQKSQNLEKNDKKSIQRRLKNVLSKKKKKKSKDKKKSRNKVFVDISVCVDSSPCFDTNITHVDEINDIILKDLDDEDDDDYQSLTPLSAITEECEEDVCSVDCVYDCDELIKRLKAIGTLSEQPTRPGTSQGSKRVTFADDDNLEEVREFLPEMRLENTDKNTDMNSVASKLSNIEGTRKESPRSIAPWRVLGSALRSKRKFKRKKIPKVDCKQIEKRPDSPMPKAITDTHRGELCEISEEVEAEVVKRLNRKQEEYEPVEVVIRTLPNGSFYEETVSGDKVYGHLTDAQLKYKVSTILEKDIPIKIHNVPAKEEVKRPLRRRSSIRHPGLPPEMLPPVNNPFVTKCVDWSKFTKPQRDASPVTEDTQISPLFLSMRHCKYIRWTNHDLEILKRLDDKDALMF